MTKAIDRARYLPGTDQPVILEKPILFSRMFMWIIIAMVGGLVGWAYFAQIDLSVPAAGKLEPQGNVKEVQAPVGGVVQELKVKENQTVKKGDILVTLETNVSQAQNKALLQGKATLEAENKFFEAQLNGGDLGVMTLDPGQEFRANQQRLLTASLVERQTRRAATEQEIAQLRAQLEQGRQQGGSLRKILEVNEGILTQSETILAKNESTLEAMRPVKESGALSRLQYDRQDIEVETRRADVLNRRSQIASTQGDIDRLSEEENRIKAAISQAEERLSNTIAQTEREILQRISDNQRRITEIDAQMEQAKQTLKYQAIHAPISGTVFDIKASGPGYVISGNTVTEPLMKIVPNDKLVAKVFIQQKDIGFLKKHLETKEPLKVSVKVDSYPNLEYGSIDGTLEWVGKDVLPPIQERPFPSFPARILIKEQVLLSGKCDNPEDKKKCIELPLQSGMSINTNIKTRKRSVLSIFLSQFTGKAEQFETVR